MKIWVVRHPRPLVASGVCYGQLDVEIDRSALDSLARTLSNHLPKSVPIYCSSLIRSYALAKAIQVFRPDTTIQSDYRLNEFNFGIWEGVLWRDIPKAEIDAWVQSFPSHYFGGEECVQGFIQRIKSMLLELGGIDEMILITHAGVIRALHFLIKNDQREAIDANDWPKFAIDFGEFELINYPSLNCNI